MIKISCKECGVQGIETEDTNGKKIVCPNCGNTIVSGDVYKFMTGN